MTSQKLKGKVVFLVSTFYQIFFVDMKLVWKCYGLLLLQPNIADRYMEIVNKALSRMKKRSNRRIKFHLAQETH